ncbi:MAG: arginine--tRNA ligase, partial [Candidatus Omnitrophica bacterium]|nr:arginine--tRNA ligase [Candidatus Omnitrophota bacterium]
IAYHKNKYSRGYSKLIDLLGPDHHGYIKRMKAAVQAMGHEAASLDILIVQLVTLMRGGEPVRMSTRKGEFITLREIIDEIGTDVARFFFLMRKLDSHLDFDIELAKKESSDNPVYYIQYAYARICSICKKTEDGSLNFDIDKINLSLLNTEKDKDLIRKIGDFPTAVLLTAELLEPSRLITYLIELASTFHSFYGECRVISEDQELSNARGFLVECVRIVLANGLNLLNISLPEKM